MKVLKKISSLTFVSLCAFLPYSYAGDITFPSRAVAGDDAGKPVYHCSGLSASGHRVYVRIKGNRGVVQLTIPDPGSQSVNLSNIEDCLLQNGLMGQEEIERYRKAVKSCRNLYHSRKVQVQKKTGRTVSTSKAFNFDQCLSQNLK